MRKPKQPNRKQPPQQRKPNDLSHCLAAVDSNHTLIAVVELSLSSWLVARVVPRVERLPLKKLKPEPGALLELLQRWRLEAERSGRKITRITRLNGWPISSPVNASPWSSRATAHDSGSMQIATLSS